MNQNSSASGLKPVFGFLECSGRFVIRIEARFEAAHYLYRYFPDGSDEPIHGHSWLVEVFLRRLDDGIGEDGISVDFMAARKRLDQLTHRLEHTSINDLEEFSGINPTAENVARWYYAGLRTFIGEAVIHEIRVHEGQANYASFFPYV